MARKDFLPLFDQGGGAHTIKHPAVNEINTEFNRPINAYIRDELEGKSGMGYTRFSSQRMVELKIMGWPIEVLAIGGIFALTQLMAVGLGLLRSGWSLPESLLMLLDIVAVVALFGLLNWVRQRSAM